jgi:hypothetical protein
VLLFAQMQSQSADATEPVSISDRTCLFLDDRFVAEQSGLKRTWHQGKPQPEPAITGTWPHMFGSVLHDPQAKLYKMWYEDVAHGMGWIHYAESKDGKRWTKPNLGLVELDGSKANNCIWKGAELPNVFLDPNDSDPRGRFKMFLWARTFEHQGQKMGGLVVLRSADGIAWEPVGGVAMPATTDDTASARTVLDTNQVIWDPLGKRYLGTFRTFPSFPGMSGFVRDEKYQTTFRLGGHRRAVGVTSSQGLLTGWSPIVNVLKPDANDDEKAARLGKDPNKLDHCELYIMPTFVYGNHYLGMVSLLFYVDESDTVNGGGDIQFTFSHDGEKWFRQPDRQTFVEPNPAGLVPTYAQCNEPLILGDEMWIYYTEAHSAHPKTGDTSQLRAAVWRKDGFVSLDAAGKGSLTTQPLAFTGKKLFVNFEGTATVTALDERGKPLKGVKPQTLKGDSVAQPVDWDLSAAKGQPIRLQFTLQRGRLWSFRFAP